MTQVIVFQEGGAWKTVHPAPHVTDLSALAITVVPDGTTWQEVTHPGGNAEFDGMAFVPGGVSSDQVNAERDRRVLAGNTFTVTGYGDIPVGGDETTARNLQGLAFAAQLRMAEGDTTTLTSYRDEANVIHQLTPPQIIELWSMGVAYISAVYQASWVLKDGASIPNNYEEDVHWPA